MPVIVIGADTPVGEAIALRFAGDHREVRAFVSDPDSAGRLRRHGIKVATGDVSDDSHLAGAAAGCFSAVLVIQATEDGRDRAFAHDAPGVLGGWGRAMEAAKVRRVIWVTSVDPPPLRIAEVATVTPDDPAVAERVYDLDAAGSI